MSNRRLQPECLLIASLGLLGFYPEVGCELFLFHQETESRLEIIKLTGDRHVPRGAHSIIAHDLSQVKRIYSDSEWQNVSVVDARIKFASEGYTERTF